MHNGSACLRSTLLSAAFCALVFGATANAAQQWMPIDVPDSISTSPLTITGHNLIVGQYANGNTSGFMRTPDGAITKFSEPDTTGATNPMGANYAGDIVGDFALSDGTSGFLRKSDGTFTAFQIGSDDTHPRAINSKGAIAGYSQSGGTYSAFLRNPDGSITPILQGTSAVAIAINRSGVVAGYTVGTWHGFVRGRLGKITQFDPPDSIITNALAINDSGTIAGLFIDAHNGALHGFVRQPDGTITTFDAPDAPAGTQVRGMDNDGNIVGCAMTNQALSHGFVREPSGTFHIVDAPDATSTCITAIGRAGRLIGQDFDRVGNQHGFLAAPSVWQQ